MRRNSMQTVDFHTHLLNPGVSFDRTFDKAVIPVFATLLGFDAKALKKDKYSEYTRGLLHGVKTSKHVKKIVLFPVDSRVNDDGCVVDHDKTVCSCNDAVDALYQTHPEHIIPFFSINPNRKDALELIDTYVARGFVGAKFLQNYWYIDASDEKYRAYYEKLKEHNIPLIIHTGNEGTIDASRAFEGVDMLHLALEVGVRVVAAHMASGHMDNGWRFWRNFSHNEDYFNAQYFELLRMLETHENLYADISAMLTPTRARTLRHLSKQTHIHHKLLFGTDFPVPFNIRYNTLDLSKEVLKSVASIKNPFDRYTAVILAFFGEENALFSNYKKLLKDT